jgi:hypothetical protein
MNMQPILSKAISLACITAMLTGPLGCSSSRSEIEEEVHISVTTPDTNRHETWGTVETLVLPYAAPMELAYKLDATSTNDPALWLRGGHVTLSAMGGTIEIDADGNTAVAHSKDQVVANISWDSRFTQLVLDVGGKAPYQIDTSGVPEELRPAFVGGLTLRFLQGEEMDGIPGMDEAHGVVIVLLVAVILIEVSILISQIGNYATYSDCVANLPTDCQKQAEQECWTIAEDEDPNTPKPKFACSQGSCDCSSFGCRIGWSQPTFTCETACGETAEECVANRSQTADVDAPIE